MTIDISQLAPGHHVRVLRYRDGALLQGTIARVDPRSAWAELADDDHTRIHIYDTLISHRKAAA